MTTPGKPNDRAAKNKRDREVEQLVALEESDDPKETLLYGVPDQMLDKPKVTGGDTKK